MENSVVLESVTMKKNYFYLKRIIDILAACILAIICFIPAIIVSICIKCESKGPVLFKQARTGYMGKEFNLYKFRSMTKDNNVMDFSSGDKITKVGKFIRKTSLDEIPQLINILKGEMSFVGPRPWIVEYVKNFDDNQMHRLDVLPGITGLAQVSGRNSITIFDKIESDLDYVKNYSLKFDIKILFLTLIAVLSRVGVDLGKQGIQEELEELRKNKESK